MKWIIATCVLLVSLIACSDPAEEIKAKAEQAKADSLRAEIRATQGRIDSLKTESTKLNRVIDSLGIPRVK